MVYCVSTKVAWTKKNLCYHNGNWLFSDDYTERWDDAFYAAGFFIALAGVLAWLTGELAKRDAKTEQEK